MASRSVLHDARVVAADGELGRVRHIVMDERLEEATDLVVGQGSEEWLVPMSAVVHVEGDQITLRGARSLFQGAHHFNREEYDIVEETDENASGPAESAAPATPASSPPTLRRPASPPNGCRLQLREERLRLRTTTEEAGAVRVTKQVIERTETFSVPVREERVVVEVMPGAGSIRVGDRELREGETLEVPLREERVVVDTEVIVNEDVTIRTEVVERTEPVSAALRTEELVVDMRGEARVESRLAADKRARSGPAPHSSR